jgi:hypothetical protein
MVHYGPHAGDLGSVDVETELSCTSAHPWLSPRLPLLRVFRVNQECGGAATCSKPDSQFNGSRNTILHRSSSHSRMATSIRALLNDKVSVDDRPHTGPWLRFFRAAVSAPRSTFA